MENGNLLTNCSQFATEKTSRLLKLKGWISRVSQSLLQALVDNKEVRVYQRRDRKGQSYWIINDPVSRQTIFLATEAEVLRWIEARYH